MEIVSVEERWLKTRGAVNWTKRFQYVRNTNEGSSEVITNNNK